MAGIFMELLLLSAMFFFAFYKAEKNWNAITRIVLSSIIIVLTLVGTVMKFNVGNVLFQMFIRSIGGMVLGVSIAQLAGHIQPEEERRPFDFHLPDGRPIPKIED